MNEESVLVLGAASWNRMVHVNQLPQGTSATIFDAHETVGAGSTGVGKAMALSALGHKTTLHCALGRDAYAKKITDACKAHRILMMVDETDEPTPQHLNIMDRDGGRYSLFIEGGAADPQLDENRVSAAVDKACAIFLSLSASSKKLLHLLDDLEKDILLDLHDYDGINPWYDDFIACADVIQLSDVALSDPEPVIQKLLAGSARQVVVTKGSAGAEIITATQRVQIAACHAVLTDSNGAGDAFSVGLWHAQAQGRSLQAAGAFAAATAAFAVECDGLFPANLSIDAIDARSRTQ